MAKLYSIGVGVGDKTSLTLKAIQTLEKIDVLYCPTSKSDNDSIALSIAKEFLSDDIEIKNRHFPMIRDSKKLEPVFKNISDEIEQDIKNGKDVGFITIGDSMIYSTFIYILKNLKSKIEIETVSGIPSFVDVASKISFPIAFDDAPFIVIPSTISMEQMEKYIVDFDNLVIMKAYKNYKDIIELIKKYNLEKNTLIVSNSSREKEKIITSKNIDQENNEYLTTILINKRWSI